MNAADFLEGLRDDSGDVLIRHAYADWLDERGDSAGEFYRLSGDLIETEPGSVDEELIEARMEFLFRTLLEPRWRAATDGLRLPGWSLERGLLTLHYPYDDQVSVLSREMSDAAARVPVYAAELLEQAASATDVTAERLYWLRRVWMRDPEWFGEVAHELRTWFARLRDLRSAGAALVSPDRLASLCPNLHTLEYAGGSESGFAAHLGRFTQLRSLTLSATDAQGLADVLSALPPTLRSLSVQTSVRGTARKSDPLDVTPAAQLTSLTYGAACPFDGRGVDLTELGSRPIVRTLEELRFNVHEILDPIGLPQKPPLLRRFLGRLDATTDGLHHFCDRWGRHLSDLRLFLNASGSGTHARAELTDAIRPLLDSGTLRGLSLNTPAGTSLRFPKLAGTPLADSLESVTVYDITSLARLVEADCPRLRRLELRISGSVDRADLAPLLRSDLVSRLEVVHLTAPQVSGGIVDDLTQTLGPGVRSLEIFVANLSSSGVQSLTNSDLPHRLDVLRVNLADQAEEDDDRFETLREAFPQLDKN